MNKKRLIIIAIAFILCIISFYLYLNSKNKLITESIEKITIKYYPGHDISTARFINEDYNYIDEVTFDLTGEDYLKAKNFFSKIKPTRINLDECECIATTDDYELFVNDSIKIGMGYEFGSVNDVLFDIPGEIDEFFDNVISKYNEENIYSKLNSSNATIEMNDNKTILMDKDEINKLLSYRYYKINDYNEYISGGKSPDIVLYLDNDINIYLFDNDLAYISNSNKTEYVLFVKENMMSIHDYVENIINNDKLNVNTIKMKYDGNSYEITGQEKIYKRNSEI